SNLSSAGVALNADRSALSSNATAIATEQTQIGNLRSAMDYMRTIEPEQFNRNHASITALGLSGCSTYTACVGVATTALETRARNLNDLVTQSGALNTSVNNRLTSLESQYATVHGVLTSSGVTLSNATALADLKTTVFTKGWTDIGAGSTLGSFLSATQTATAGIAESTLAAQAASL